MTEENIPSQPSLSSGKEVESNALLASAVKVTAKRKKLCEESKGNPAFVTNLEIVDYCKRKGYTLTAIGRIGFRYKRKDGSDCILLSAAARG